MAVSLGGVDARVVENHVRTFCASATFEGMVVGSTRRQLERHRAAGHLIVLVSATSLVVTKGLAEYFGADIVCGSVCPRSQKDEVSTPNLILT